MLAKIHAVSGSGQLRNHDELALDANVLVQDQKDPIQALWWKYLAALILLLSHKAKEIILEANGFL